MFGTLLINERVNKMKTRGFLSTLFAIMAACALQLTTSTAQAASDKYSAQLLSPVAGQVLYAGQKIMIEWKHTLPNIPLPGCESEAWLSLDGGSTFPVWIAWTRPEEYISPLDCPEYAYPRGGLGHPLRM